MTKTIPNMLVELFVFNISSEVLSLNLKVDQNLQADQNDFVFARQW